MQNFWNPLSVWPHYEIQMYARALLKLALPHFPVSLGEWKKIHMPELEFELIPEAGGIPTLEQTLNL